MIPMLARMIGLTLFSRHVDRLSPVTAALLRLVMVLVVYGSLLWATLSGSLGYTSLYWWLWIDAFVVGCWVPVILSRHQRQRSMVPFWLIHYMGFFTLTPGLLFHFLISRRLGVDESGWVLVLAAVVSLVLHGWLTHRQWWGSPPPLSGKGVAWLMVVPYLRLAVVYVGTFLTISVRGVKLESREPIDWDGVHTAGVALAWTKVGLELVLALLGIVLALVHQARESGDGGRGRRVRR